MLRPCNLLGRPLLVGLVVWVGCLAWLELFVFVCILQLNVTKPLECAK